MRWKGDEADGATGGCERESGDLNIHGERLARFERL